MKIILFGYGKLGQAIEKAALSNGHEIIGRIGSKDKNLLSPAFLKSADVVIENTRPDCAFEHVKLCLEAGVPVISGTTGWNEKHAEAVAICQALKGTFLHASNFSIGVNLFFVLNEKLASMMKEQKQYRPDIFESHHTQKLDAPSGTAVSLANGIISNSDSLDKWILGETDSPDTLPIAAERVGEVSGTHIVTWQSEVDKIEIKHEAFNRSGFASGAVLAAEWIVGRKGFFTMRDVLSI